MKKRISLFFLVLVLIFSNTMPVMAATKTYKAAEQAYKKYLKKKSVHGSKIVDVDKNGVPELLTECRVNGRWYYMLCTYNKKTKKVVVLKKVMVGKDFPESFRYNVSKKQVYFNQSSTGGAKETIVKVKGTKISTVKTFQSIRKYPGFSYTYKVNGKKVSYNTWKKKRAAATKGFKNYRNFY